MAPVSGSRSCPYCFSMFSRPNAASRHAKGCPKRQGRSVSRKTGRRLKSCNECARSKVHCFLRDPGNSPICERCHSRKLGCSFVRLSASSADDSIQPDQGDRGLLEFFLTSTDNERDFVVENAVAEEPDGEVPNSINFGTSAFEPATDVLFDFIDPSVLLSSDMEDGSGDAELATIDTDSFLDDPSNSLLAARLNALEMDIAAGGQIFCSDFLPQTPLSISIDPLAHLRSGESSLPLLLVVALTGAAYTFHPEHPKSAAAEVRTFYILADNYVFGCMETFNALSGTYELAESIQVCQAALLMYALGTLPARDQGMQEGAVTRRLPALISVLRKPDFFRCRHEPSGNASHFLQREQIIRLVAWTFCADSLATLTYNKPPSCSLSEMVGGLPCEAAVWEADLALALKSSTRGSTSGISLKDLMSRLLRSEVISAEDIPLFHVHIMLCAIQQIVYNAHVSMSLDATRVLSALKVWRRIWSAALQRLSPEEHRLLGVAKYVSNLEYLIRRTVEVASDQTLASESEYLKRIPSTDARHLHAFIKEYVSPK